MQNQCAKSYSVAQNLIIVVVKDIQYSLLLKSEL